MRMEDGKKRITQVGNGLFYLALMLETLFVLLDKSSYIIQHETWLFRMTFLMFCCKIAVTRYSKKEWLVIIAMGIMGIISWMATDREEIIRIVALVVACKNVDIKQMTKLIFYETLFGSLVIVGLSLAGIYGTVTVSGLFRGGGIEETRYCLGMGHPNALHCMFMVTLILGLAIYQKRMKWYGYVISFLLNFGLYLLTDSRTSLLITAIAIIFAAFLKYAKSIRDKKVVYILAIIFVVCCVLWSIMIATVGVSPHILRQIDIRINGRFQYARSDGGIQFWSLFSNPDNQNFFDMGYVRLFYWYGIIPALVYIVALCETVWACYKQKAYDAFLVIMVFVFYSLIEAHAISTYIGRNYVLLYMGVLWYTVWDTVSGKEFAIIDLLNIKSRKGIENNGRKI